MTTRDFDPLRLDVAAFSKEAGELAGHWALRQLPRVAASVSGDMPAAVDDPVDWSARGESRPTRATERETRLHLRAQAQVPFECQRCLKPVLYELDVDRHFLFVHGEDTAARLDEESEDDVLALTRALDLRELVEDELLLAMPLVPRHEVCPEPLQPPSIDDANQVDEPQNPFAALAALKGDGGLN